ncbi:MAG TPA: 3-methyl-2-oxobutanoate hydroxymethyltransferase [Mariprofundaceae bacterium]|nr:3-methyl-2-oxobutanoate hydroxymethyltransferase [Mariprofundaceae bacterium]
MSKRITAATLAKAKAANEKSVWLTAYDTTSAQLAELAGVDVLLVGDSLGMVALGYDSTIPVTLDHMIHHTTAVVRGRSKAWVVCDLPFGTYQQSPEQAFETSARVLQETGCDAVKLEGGIPMAETIRFLSERGIAVVAHVGLTPQSVKKFGSYKARGKNPAEQDAIIKDAKAVTDAGAVALVIECIPAELAKEITESVAIPTVGIGAGSDCDSQVLVWHDLLGLSEKNPPFAPAYTNLREQITSAISQWTADVKNGTFPK